MIAKSMQVKEDVEGVLSNYHSTQATTLNYRSKDEDQMVKIMLKIMILLMALCYEYEAFLKLGAPISETGRRFFT